MSDKKYAGMKEVTDWIKNCPSEEFMRTFNELKDDYSGPTIGDFLGDSDDTEGGYYDINEDFKEIIEKLKNSTLIYLISFKFMIIIGLKEKISILYIIQDCILRSVSRILKV